jgi:hypothetical protein
MAHFTSARNAQINVTYDLEYVSGIANHTCLAKVSCMVEGSMITMQSRIRAILINHYSVHGNGHGIYQHVWTFDVHPIRVGASSGSLAEQIEVLHHWRDHSITSEPQIAVEIDGVWQQDRLIGSHVFGFVWDLKSRWSEIAE